MKISPKTSHKWLIGSGKIHHEKDLDHKKVLRGLTAAYTGPQTAHFEFTWSRFWTSFSISSKCSDINSKPHFLRKA